MCIFLPVPVVSDPSSIVAVSSEVSDGIIRHSLIFIDEHLKLANADTQVRLIESIRDVPAERAELTTLLNQSVEETKTK